MILNPPFKQFEFSIQRKYVLFQSDEKHFYPLENESDEYWMNLVNDTIGHTDITVVGFYNSQYWFLKNNKSIHQEIYTLDLENGEAKLFQIADSLDALYKICLELKQFIEENGSTQPLVKTPETVSRMKKIMSDFSNYSPNSYSRFWQEHAMGELIIGLEL